MEKKEGIILFTKNRPKTLPTILNQLNNVGCPIVVLDDSLLTETKNIVANTPGTTNIYYHGTQEQSKILRNIKSAGLNVDFFTRPLGTKEWNLGYTRNYAILLAKAAGFERVLFTDDDILIEDSNLVPEMMALLNNADFVGAKIGGMPDDSVVGHIMRNVGMQPYEDAYGFLSGGFLAFNLNSVSEYFLNYYNEDWIWLGLHKHKARIVRHGEVSQLQFNPFENAVKRALDQEFGEVLIEGIQRAHALGDVSLLTNEKFWMESLVDISMTIKKLLPLCLEKDIKAIATTVCSALLGYHNTLHPDTFTKLFVEYFDKRTEWISILNSYKLAEEHIYNEV